MLRDLNPASCLALEQNKFVFTTAELIKITVLKLHLYIQEVISETRKTCLSRQLGLPMIHHI